LKQPFNFPEFQSSARNDFNCYAKTIPMKHVQWTSTAHYKVVLLHLA